LAVATALDHAGKANLWQPALAERFKRARPNY
jgi:hypothetical protein